MDTIIKTLNFNEPKFNISEVRRYCGIKINCDNNDLDKEIVHCFNEIHNKLSYRICYTEEKLNFYNGEIVTNCFKTDSINLIKNLSNCKKIIVFAATIGIETDRYINRYSKISPLKSLIFQSIGTERIEALCDNFCEKIKNDFSKENMFIRPRYSPGYGDFGLDYQKNIISFLDAQRKIGLTLNDSLIMSPTKSVTAVVGITDFIESCNDNACLNCENKECNFRR